MPTEVVKQRTQAQHGGSKLGSFAIARALAASEGASGFYRGFGATVIREIPFAGVQYPIYEFLKREAAVLLGRKGERLAAGPAAVCGSIAGGIAGALTTPLDVLKTRIMLDTTVSAQFLHAPLFDADHSFRLQGLARTFGRYMLRAVCLRSSRVSFHVHFGSPQAAPSSSAYTSGVSTPLYGQASSTILRQSGSRMIRLCTI